jgi:hypothetical protein
MQSTGQEATEWVHHSQLTPSKAAKAVVVGSHIAGREQVAACTARHAALAGIGVELAADTLLALGRGPAEGPINVIAV